MLHSHSKVHDRDNGSDNGSNKGSETKHDDDGTTDIGLDTGHSLAVTMI